MYFWQSKYPINLRMTRDAMAATTTSTNETPAASSSQPSASSSQPNASSSQPSQKSMSKAERRELQEKQRAAKLAQKQQPQSGDTPNKPKAKPKTDSAQRRGSGAAEKTQSSGVDASAMDIETATNKSRSLRIFSHFGLTKHGHGVKGDIHPCIIRLALQFSEFRICGANARCIATLTAFKTVRCIACKSCIHMNAPTGDSRLHHASQ
jgi:translation initiation factor eIF-2B subunit delta